MGTSTVIEAHTMEELEKRVKKWFKQLRKMELHESIGWHPNRVQTTDDGYAIFVRAHT